ncbi:hypothetical protein [Micromonospora tulbaghiae]|uniref:hypothetical protein n=1 Tax=Micromonospora tulbaghiae TaxID=479978 RepID=UPI00343FE2A6
MIKDHRDYRTLHWTVEVDGPWSPTAVERYITGGYDGLLYRAPRGVKHRSLEFLLQLPGLRSLTVHGRVADDSAVNEIESVEHLVLLTRSPVPLAVDRLQRLHSLTVDARPDMSGVRGLTGLEALYLAWWHGTDLSFLGDKPHLRRLRLDGRPARLQLDGIEACTALTSLEVLDYRVAALAPLRGLTRMETILVSGPRKLPADNDLDLRDLSAMPHLRSLRLIAAGMIRSLRPIKALPQLRDLRLNEVVIGDGDLSPLFRMPSWAEVVPPTRFLDDPARYSHTIAELRALTKQG